MTHGARPEAPPPACFVRVAFCAVALALSAASGQTAPGTSDAVRYSARLDTTLFRAVNSDAGWCFEPQPRPACKKFWITELNGYQALGASHFTEQTSAGPQIRRDLHEHFNVSVGGMVNHRPRAAFGAAVMLGDGPEGERVGVEARARRWLGAHGAVDVSAGPLEALVHAPPPSGRARGYGVGADVSLMWFDWVGLTVRGEVLRAEGRTVHALYAGARLGTYPAVVVTAGIGALVSYFALLGRDP